jgi:hypothetical protein
MPSLPRMRLKVPDTGGFFTLAFFDAGSPGEGGGAPWGGREARQ